jgi:hypothetical protein
MGITRNRVATTSQISWLGQYKQSNDSPQPPSTSRSMQVKVLLIASSDSSARTDISLLLHLTFKITLADYDVSKQDNPVPDQGPGEDADHCPSRLFSYAPDCWLCLVSSCTKVDKRRGRQVVWERRSTVPICKDCAPPLLFVSQHVH